MLTVAAASAGWKLALVPTGIVCLAILSALSRNKKVGMTPERKAIFETFMNECKDAVELRNMAAVFAGEGLQAESIMLEGKAKLRALSPELKAERRAIFRKAMQSKDPAAVEGMAKAYESEYCMGAARHLYEYARGLRGIPQTDDSYVTEIEAEPAKVRIDTDGTVEVIEDTPDHGEPAKQASRAVPKEPPAAPQGQAPQGAA